MELPKIHKSKHKSLRSQNKPTEDEIVEEICENIDENEANSASENVKSVVNGGRKIDVKALDGGGTSVAEFEVVTEKSGKEKEGRRDGVVLGDGNKKKELRQRESVLSDDVEAGIDDKIQKGILGYMDRQMKTQKKTQSLSDPQGSPAIRSTRSRSSNEKSPRRKRSKSESRRRRERKLIAAGELEVRQANETLMRYLKQCSEINDASLSGELEIDKNLEDRKVYRKTKAQRNRRSHLITGKTNGKMPQSDLATVLNELNDDILPSHGEIYNPFTPVVSPTEGPPTHIDRMYIQTPKGYRSVDNTFYKTHIDQDPDSDCGPIQTGVQLSLAIQRAWILISNLCHGLLGGLALAHLLFIFTTKPYDWADGSIKHYASFAEIYANTFYCLAIVCMVSILDR